MTLGEIVVGAGALLGLGYLYEHGDLNGILGNFGVAGSTGTGTSTSTSTGSTTYSTSSAAATQAINSWAALNLNANDSRLAVVQAFYAANGRVPASWTEFVDWASTNGYLSTDLTQWSGTPTGRVA